MRTVQEPWYTPDHPDQTTDQKHRDRPNGATNTTGPTQATNPTSATGANGATGERPTIHGPSQIRCICPDHSNNINDILNRLQPPPKDPAPGRDFPTGNDPPPY